MSFIFSLIVQFFTEVIQQLYLSNSPLTSAIILLANGFWIVVLLMFLGAAKSLWRDWRQTLYHVATRNFIMLAIDVPRDNEQSPKAVEYIFAHLHGVLPGSNNMYEEWWEGKTEDYFSMELVSIEGYVQFLVYTQEEYRDTVESAFYAQYPDAEITQVEDYVNGQNGEFKNLKFPSQKYKLFGTEFVLAKNQAYPIRLHPEFEHSLSQEFKDPMASLLENMNKIGPGEQIWLQLVITPERDKNWQPAANNVAMKIAGKKIDAPSGRVDKIAGGFIKWLDAFGVAVFPFYNATEESDKKDDLPSLMLHLTPTEKAQIEGIQLKADKMAFWCKFRFIYIAEKEIYSKQRGVSTILGSMKQFSSLNLNSFVMHKYTKTSGMDYIFTEKRMARRQNNILLAFQERARSEGSDGIVLNIEELATIYHFPTITVKAPLVSRTQSKRSSAPVSLPIQGAPRTFQSFASYAPQPLEEPKNTEQASNAPSPAPRDNSNSGVPGDLPFI